MALTIGTALGIVFGLGGIAFSRRAAAGVLALVLIASVISFVNVAWVTPAANQAFRSLMSGGQAAPGVAEFSLGQLAREIDVFNHDPAFSRFGYLLALLFAYHSRLALSCSPLVFAFFALSIASDGCLRRWTLGIAACLAFLGYYMLLNGGSSWVWNLTMPAVAVAWLPNLTLILVRLRYRRLGPDRQKFPDDSPWRSSSRARGPRVRYTNDGAAGRSGRGRSSGRVRQRNKFRSDVAKPMGTAGWLCRVPESDCRLRMEEGAARSGAGGATSRWRCFEPDGRILVRGVCRRDAPADAALALWPSADRRDPSDAVDGLARVSHARRASSGASGGRNAWNGTWSGGRAISGRGSRAALALGMIGSAASLGTTAWLLPASQRAMYVAAAGYDDGRTYRADVFFVAELSQFDAIKRPDANTQPVVNVARHARWAISCAPLVLTLFVLSIAGLSRAGRFDMTLYACAAMFGYYSVDPNHERTGVLRQAARIGGRLAAEPRRCGRCGGGSHGASQNCARAGLKACATTERLLRVLRVLCVDRRRGVGRGKPEGLRLQSEAGPALCVPFALRSVAPRLEAQRRAPAAS